MDVFLSDVSRECRLLCREEKGKGEGVVVMIVSGSVVVSRGGVGEM